MDRRENFEQQHSYYQNQAKKNQRIADYSLDDENYRTYQHRANQSQKKVDEISDKVDETVANSGESGIIKESKPKKKQLNSIKIDNSKTKKAADLSKTGSKGFSEKAKTELYQNESIISGNNYETAILYNSQGERIFVKKGKKDSVIFTRKEILQMKNCILTHNHPNGIVFSPEDINMLRKGKLSEIRACKSRGTYVLRSASKWDGSISNFQEIDDEYWKIMNEVEKNIASCPLSKGSLFFIT